MSEYTPDSFVVKLSKLKENDLEQAISQACDFVEGQAKLKCPVNTGQLKASITHTVEKEGKSVVGYVGTNVEYAPYVEFGTGLFAAEGNGRQDVPWVYQSADGTWHSTSGQDPQPFLQPALDNNRSKVLDIIKEELRSDLHNV